MHRLLIVFLSLCSGAQTATAQDSAVTLYGPESVVRLLETPQFPAPDATGKTSFAESRFADFQTMQGYDSGYFGAFAMSDDGASGMSGQQHTRADAHAAAIAECNDFRGTAQGKCRVVAERVPVGHRDDTAVTLSQGAARAWAKYASSAGPKAFALGTVGNWASHHSGRPLDDAKTRALANCDREGGDGPRHGGQPCRIIDAAP